VFDEVRQNIYFRDARNGSVLKVTSNVITRPNLILVDAVRLRKKQPPLLYIYSTYNEL